MRKAERSVSKQVISSLALFIGQITNHTTVKSPIVFRFKNVFHNRISSKFSLVLNQQSTPKQRKPISTCVVYIPPINSKKIWPRNFWRTQKSTRGQENIMQCLSENNIMRNDQPYSSFRPSRRNSYENKSSMFAVKDFLIFAKAST